ncbi:MAG: invasion associated locus B family protein [Rhodobiaceae bacterium]|nr:invasion associated locus B family protein [Rhodobiaceae bacterium]MCC0050630.1 invasion associated locus B family protein [Rhodobiaceae bacterium]MCC0059833.1 invasion associated locus B family protein [Rhodobiaceae bacterium]
MPVIPTRRGPTRCGKPWNVVAMAFAIVFGAFCALPAQPVQAQGLLKETIGDWQFRCDTPPGAPSEQCALVQSVTAEDRQNVGLTVVILQTADKKDTILRVLAPLGVLIPSGLGLIIDDKQVGRTAFARCQPTGCVAEVFFDPALLEQFRSGTSALFIIFQTPEEGIGIPVSLQGFSTALDKLKQ